MTCQAESLEVCRTVEAGSGWSVFDENRFRDSFARGFAHVDQVHVIKYSLKSSYKNIPIICMHSLN